MLRSNKNNWKAPSLKEKIEEKLNDKGLFAFGVRGVVWNVNLVQRYD